MKDTLLFLWPYLWRYRRSLWLGMGALTVKALLAVSQPLLMRASITALTSGEGPRAALWFAAGLVAVSAVKGFFQYWMRVILIGMSREVEFDLRNELFASLLKLDPAFYGRNRTGDILARATNDLNSVRIMVGPAVMYWFETGITLVMAVAVMLWVDWPLALIALIPAPFITLVETVLGRKVHDRFEAIQATFADISSRVQENLAGVRVVRGYRQEDAELAEFEKLNRGYIGQSLELARIDSMFTPLLQALVALGFLLVLGAGGWRMSTGRLSAGSFVMFNTYMGMLVWPMIAMGWVINLTQRGRASLTRVRELLDEHPAIAAPASPVTLPSPLRGEIQFHDAGVRFDTRDALSGVSFKIDAGSTVAIVGHTGSGKSTLANLIPRMLDPTSGRVTIDGIDLRECDPRDLRRAIGHVPQETFLFSATLRENIAFGVPDAKEEDIRRAADAAGLGSDLEGFPNGLDTIVGERGITLSGGQKQRTAIARALLRNPRILVLDDALSAVDTATEENILTTLTKLRQGLTTILISHRVSTVRGADRIVVVEHGEVVAQGSHNDLLAQGGYYADLHQKQLLEEELEAI